MCKITPPLDWSFQSLASFISHNCLVELPSTIWVNPVFNVSVLKPYEVSVDEPDDELSEEPVSQEILRLENITAISSLCWRGNQDRTEALLRVLIKQIAAWICCMNLLHCAKRSTHWLLDTRGGITATLSFFSLFERYMTLPVGTWSSALDQSFRSQCGRLLRTSQSITTSFFGEKETNFFGSKLKLTCGVLATLVVWTARVSRSMELSIGCVRRLTGAFRRPNEN